MSSEARGPQSTVTVRWFPPSWIAIASPTALIYIDPAYLKTYFKNYPTRIEYSTWPDEVDGLPEPLAPADLILATHAHKDHCKGVTVARLRGSNTVVAGPASCRKELGDDILVVVPGDVVQLGDVTASAVPAHNTASGSSTRKQHPVGRDVGYVISVGGVTIYHAGDTDLLPEMSHLGPVDVACLPIGGTFTMDPEEAAQATVAIQPKHVTPMHRLRRNVTEFIDALERAGSTANPALLEIGDELAC